jgi:PAS domain S-box-containing protein
MKKGKNQSHKNKLRQRAEEFITKNPSAIKKTPPGDVKKLIEDLRIHQVELEMQNEELRRAQLELEAARDKYADLYDFAPIGYFAFDETARIQDVNLTGADLLGPSKSKLLNLKFSAFVSPGFQDDFYFHMQGLLQTGSQQTCELQLQKKDRTPFYAKLDSIAVKDKTNNLKQIRTALTDITERVLIGKDLQKAHDKLEKRVEKRTAELAKSNVSLNREIAERRRLAYRFLNAQEDERRRIALELHDDLGQDLSVLKLQVDSLVRQLSESQAATKDHIASTSALLSNTIEKVRRICHELIPPVLVDLGLAPALRWLVRSSAQYSDFEISSEIVISEDLFSTEQQIAIYRIFQEIFNNIRKHAQATQVSIRIERDNSRVLFRVADNGIGFDMKRIKSLPAAERGLGLAGMEERVMMMDGKFEIVSCVGKGTKIGFEIPIVCPP